MFAIGHIALGHIAGKIVCKATKKDVNIPLLWTLSLIPDIDLLIPMLIHRGPTHSIILTIIFLIPFLITRPRKTVPYAASLATHSLIGDYLTGEGTQLLWPISKQWIGYPYALYMGSTIEIAIELALFMVLIISLLLTKDYKSLFKKDRKNLLFVIPISTIILPAMFRFPLTIPRLLLIPHLILLGIIILPLIITIKQNIYSNNPKKIKE